jgi:hypothetical protein
MGEHTIREILKRRSPETQRAMKRRRDLAQGGSATKAWMPKLIAMLVVLGILAGIGYLGYMAHVAGQRFAADKASRNGPSVLTVSGTTEFLPNTLLAALDPGFYASSGMNGTALTHRLLHLYYPDASALEIRAMAVSLEAQYPKTDIMEALLNDAPMGGGASHPVKGLGAASLFYFGKPFAQLAPQDIALLVAMMSDPEGLDPRLHPDKALGARNAVLQADLQQNVLSQAQVDGLSKLPLDVIPQTAK